MSLTASILLSLVLFAIGAYGVMARRNLLIVLLSSEVMLNGVLLAFIALADVHRTSATGHESGGLIFALMIIALAAAETAVGLALVLVYFRTRSDAGQPSVDTRDMTLMKD